MKKLDKQVYDTRLDKTYDLSVADKSDFDQLLESFEKFGCIEYDRFKFYVRINNLNAKYKLDEC